MVRTGVQVAPEDVGARGGSRCQLPEMGPGEGLGGLACGMREAWLAEWEVARAWQGDGAAAWGAECGAYRGGGDGGRGGEARPWRGALVGRRGAAGVKREPLLQSRPGPVGRGAPVPPRPSRVRQTGSPRAILGTRQHQGWPDAALPPLGKALLLPDLGRLFLGDSLDCCGVQ